MVKCSTCNGELHLLVEERDLTKIAVLVEGGDGFKCSRCGTNVSLMEKINKVTLHCNNCDMDIAEVDKLGYSSAECMCSKILYMEGRHEWYEKKKDLKQHTQKVLKSNEDILDKTIGRIIDLGADVTKIVIDKVIPDGNITG